MKKRILTPRVNPFAILVDKANTADQPKPEQPIAAKSKARRPRTADEHPNAKSPRKTIAFARGRPLKHLSARLACQDLVPDAIKALKSALKRPGERIEAAKTILAYSYGKPQTTSNIRVIHSVQDLSEDELRTIAGEAEEIEEDNKET
jgi:hypothetical protein